nr:hypothetical protein [Bradyrhizobium manausense]
MARMFFAALTSASNILPQLVQTKRDRLMQLAASTAPQALQVCDMCAGSTTVIREPYHVALYSSMVLIVRGETSSEARFSFARLWTSAPGAATVVGLAQKLEPACASKSTWWTRTVARRRGKPKKFPDPSIRGQRALTRP